MPCPNDTTHRRRRKLERKFFQRAMMYECRIVAKRHTDNITIENESFRRATFRTICVPFFRHWSVTTSKLKIGNLLTLCGPYTVLRCKEVHYHIYIGTTVQSTYYGSETVGDLQTSMQLQLHSKSQFRNKRRIKIPIFPK